ncbi:MAG: methionyl-tRNA formyltransferase [Acidocella sp.]|nr:methionyl-tRNA formyltransferase [Acidocella sp.]
MKLAFMGSPDFAVPALRALATAHEVAMVYAQPPKPAGRGQHETNCPVHREALALGLPVRTPKRLKNNPDEAILLKSLAPDAVIVAAYGLILPPEILDIPAARGCLNIHASLLPRWRGAAPIQAAILAGDAETGITIMQMDAGLDTGAMLRRAAIPIGPADTAADLHGRLAELGARLIIETLATNQPPIPQDDTRASYAPKLSREDARLNFTKPAADLERQIRAFTPWPGALALLGDMVIKFIAAECVPGSGLPGEILDDRLTIACGEGALRPTRIQRAGRAAMSTTDFLRGVSLPANARFF